MKKIFYSAAATAVFAGNAVSGGGNAIANADDDVKQLDKDSIVGGEYVADEQAYPYSAEPNESDSIVGLRLIEGTIVWDWNKSGVVGESDEGIPNWEAIVKNNDPAIIDLTRKHTYLFPTEMVGSGGHCIMDNTRDYLPRS